MYVACTHLTDFSHTTHDQLWAAKRREEDSGRGGRGLELAARAKLHKSLLQSQAALHLITHTCNLTASAHTHTQEIAGVDKQQALIALGRFKSSVRTSLLLCDGYECQEKEGTFLVAFASSRAAVEWALTLQLALMKYCQPLPRCAAICHALLSHVMLCSSCALQGLPATPVSCYAMPHHTTLCCTTPC